jgi:hypothetical protein
MDEQRFMNTGVEVKINDDTLVIATAFVVGTTGGGYISIFEFENGRWIEKKTINTKKYFNESYQAPIHAEGAENRSFLDASDDIIALIASSARIFRKSNYERAILILKKNGNEWVYLDTMYRKDISALYSFSKTGYYGTSICVDKNTVIVPEAGKGIHVFTINENKTEECLIPDEFIIHLGKGGAAIINNNTILISDIIYEDQKYYIPSAMQRRVKVYNRIGGNWELAFIFDNNSFPDFWTNESGLSTHIGIIDDSNVYIGSNKRMYFFMKDDYGYTVKQIIEMPLREGEGSAFINDLVIKDGIMAYSRGEKIYIYHNINDTWNLTDIIDLRKLSRRFIDDIKLDISNDILVVGFDNVRKNFDDDAIVTFPFPPFFFTKNPGSVYILKIYPEGGYDIQGIIERKYNLFGRVKFVNKVK